MVRRYNRLLVLFYVLSDALLAISAFIVAYTLRFHTALIPVTKGTPPLRQYVNILPWMMIVVLSVIVFNLIADMLYGVLDPRIRLD